MDQTNHIYTNILFDWFKNKENNKKNETPIKAHPTYKYNLSESTPLSPEDLKEYKQPHNGAFNQTIGKLLHIQQWSRRDLNYAISRLAVYAKSPTAMAFQALDYIMCYLHHHMHEPIFYPNKPIGPDEAITYKWSRQQQNSHP